MAQSNGIENMTHLVYIHLNESKGAADVNYFYQRNHLGNKFLTEWKLKCTHSSIKDCKQQFVKYLHDELGTLIECDDMDAAYYQIPNWVRNRLNDVQRKLDFRTLNDPSKQFCEMDILTDFSTKMVEKEVRSLQEYYNNAQEISTGLSARIGKYIVPLKNIENCEKGKNEELPELPTMLETLNEYITNNEIPKFRGLNELIAVIGGPDS